MIPVPPNRKEQQNLEWKESWRDDCLRWICGFANADGGVLVIGRNDRDQPVGVATAARLLEEIPSKVRDVLGIMVAVNLVSEDGKDLVEIRVDPYPSPVSYKGEYHYRSGSTKQELRGAALSHFLLKKQGLHWDSVPVPFVSVADLDTRVLGQFRTFALKSQRLSAEMLQELDAALLEKLHLVERDYLKRAAVLLFHPDPERHVGGAYIKIGFFESNVDLRYQDEVHGDVLSQVGKTLDALKAKYLKAWISYDGLQRIETYPVPEPALREALLNAVVHKDYASGDSPSDQRLSRQADDLESGATAAAMDSGAAVDQAFLRAFQSGLGQRLFPGWPGRIVGARDRAHAGNLPPGGPGRSRFRARTDGGLGDVQLCAVDGGPPHPRNCPRNYPRTFANHPGTSLSAAPGRAPLDPPGACGTTVLDARRGEVPPAKTEGHGSDSPCRFDEGRTLGGVEMNAQGATHA